MPEEEPAAAARRRPPPSRTRRRGKARVDEEEPRSPFRSSLRRRTLQLRAGCAWTCALALLCGAPPGDRASAVPLPSSPFLGRDALSSRGSPFRRSAVALRQRPHVGQLHSALVSSGSSSPAPSSPPPSPAPAAPGPCSPRAGAPRVLVSKPSDIQRRLQWKPRQTVLLLLQKSITLQRGLNFSAAFSCTIFVKAPGTKHVSLIYNKDDVPLLLIMGASNILFRGIGLFFRGVTDRSPDCAWGNIGAPCPALLILQSWNIQYVKAQVLGQLVVAKSVYCRFDSLTVTAPKPLGPVPQNPRYLKDGLIVFGFNGVGIRRPIMKTMHVVSNSRIYGANVLVSLTSATVGTIIHNNYFYDFGFAAVRCGNLVHYMMDCHANLLSRNYVYRKPTKDGEPWGDSGAFYFSTKWFNPANRAVCNYIVGGDYCYYLDFASSGIRIDGGACIYPRMAAVKLNTGKWNRIRSLVLIGKPPPQVMSCITTAWLNCTSDPGSYYEDLRKRVYNVSSINKQYPRLQTVCAPSHVRFMDGTQCSPPGSLPVTCDALPYYNHNQYIVLNRRSEFDVLGFCEDYPAVRKFNSIKMYNFTDAEARFVGKGDYSVKPGSTIPRRINGFINCSKQSVGPKKIGDSSYFSSWNMAKPLVYQLVQSAVYCFGLTCN